MNNVLLWDNEMPFLHCQLSKQLAMGLSLTCQLVCSYKMVLCHFNNVYVHLHVVTQMQPFNLNYLIWSFRKHSEISYQHF